MIINIIIDVHSKTNLKNDLQKMVANVNEIEAAHG